MKHLPWFLFVAMIGCSKAKAPAAPPEATPQTAPADPAPVAPLAPAAPPETLVAGDYACSFAGYAEFLCRITVEDNFVTLEKLGGSDRFRGSMTREDDDVRWINAAGDASPADLLFKRQPDGTWFAKVEGEGEGGAGYRLRYLGEVGSQFGGQAYGGAIGKP
ncbi:MAG: hypothetical protein R3B48_08870 [Kofleriaceae bacterium]